MDRRKDDTGREDGVGELEECIITEMKAFVEGTAEVAQGVEIVGRFHSGSFCYHQL